MTLAPRPPWGLALMIRSRSRGSRRLIIRGTTTFANDGERLHHRREEQRGDRAAGGIPDRGTLPRVDLPRALGGWDPVARLRRLMTVVRDTTEGDMTPAEETTGIGGNAIGGGMGMTVVVTTPPGLDRDDPYHLDEDTNHTDTTRPSRSTHGTRTRHRAMMVTDSQRQVPPPESPVGRDPTACCLRINSRIVSP